MRPHAADVQDIHAQLLRGGLVGLRDVQARPEEVAEVIGLPPELRMQLLGM